jgi:hypothetical protein
MWILGMSRAFLLKAKFLRIVASCTRMCSVKSLTSMYLDKATWYILVCTTKTKQVHTGTYQYVCKNSKMVDMHEVGIQSKNLMHTTYVLYRYATSVNSLVIWLDSLRYIGAGHDIPDIQYLLAGGWRPEQVLHCPPLRSRRHWSRHQLGFSESPYWFCSTPWPWKLPCHPCGPPPDWETGPWDWLAHHSTS